MGASGPGCDRKNCRGRVNAHISKKEREVLEDKAINTAVVQGRESLHQVINETERWITGKRQQTQLVLVALLAGGHILLNDVPGVAKTRLAKVVGQLLGMSYARIQGTPDLLPSEVTGGLIYDPKSGDLRFRPGPIFHHIILFDEINRATPRTQAALLESMEERQVSDGGQTHLLPTPFMVLATQNPIEMEGTFLLPEAQLDRFLLSFGLGYPDLADEVSLVRRFSQADDVTRIAAIWDPAQIQQLMQQVSEVRLDDAVLTYIVNLVRATRSHPLVRMGASPRAAVQFAKAARAYAYIEGRDFVIPDDVQALAVPLLAHRLIMGAEASVGGSTAADVVRSVITEASAPVEDSH